MEQRHHHRQAVRTTNMVVAAVLVCLLLPPEARASCGDHVQPSGQPSTQETPTPAGPCTGPMCHNGSTPAPLPPTTIPVSPGESALGVASLILPPSAKSSHTHPSERLRTLLRRFPPEPPPR